MLIKILRQALQRRSSAASARAPIGGAAQSTPGDTVARAVELIAAAITLAQQDKLADAEQVLLRALALAPENADAHDALGNVLRGQEQIEAAIACYQRALRADPTRASTLSNMALCMRDLGRFDEARVHYERAANLDPSNPTIAVNLAALLFDTGHFDEAAQRMESVLSAHPDLAEAYIVRGTRLLRRGDFARGWSDYEWRDRDAGRAVPDAFSYPVWNGKPMADDVLLVRCEQGLGDQIMFASCLPDLLRVAPNCVVECNPRLKPLFARSFPQARVFAQRADPEETWLKEGLVPSARTWLGSLPLHFRRERRDFPQEKGYLRADPAKTQRWRRALQDLGPGLKIGISWRGGTGGTRRALRSIALDEFIPLLAMSNTHFVSLQYGECAAEIDRVRSSGHVDLVRCDAAIRDYDETAALVNALDLVISVQTAVAHLAGALGKPVWVLVPWVAEWRYGESGESMPWYPSARLFRQGRGGIWKDVLAQVQTALQRNAVELSKSRRPA